MSLAGDPEGPPSDVEIARLGPFYSDLLDDPGWVLRRVETVQLLDVPRIQRRVTLDIDLVALRQRAAHHGYAVGSEWLLPLGVLAKQVQTDLDARDATGAAVPIAVSQVDSIYAACVVLHQLQHIDGIYADPTFRQQVWDVVRHAGGAARYRDHLEDALRSNDRTPAQRAWIAAAGEYAFDRRIDELGSSYLLMGTLPATPASILIVKWQYRDDLIGRPSWRAQLGIWPLELEIDAPGIGSAQREHTRVIVPPGLMLEDLQLKAQHRLVPRADYVTRFSGDRAVLYTSRAQPVSTAYSFRAVLGVEPRIFSFPAVLTSWFTFTLLFGGLLLEVFDARFTAADSTVSEGAVTVLAIVPSLVTFYLVRDGEHQALTSLLNRSRLLLALASLSTLLVAGAIAAGASAPVVLTLMGAALALSGVSGFINTLAVLRPPWRGR